MKSDLTPAQILADDEDYLLDFQFAVEGGGTTAVALFSYETPRQLRRLQRRVAELLPEYRHLHIDFIGQRVHNLLHALREQPAVQEAWAEWEAANQGEARPRVLHTVHISGLEGTLLVELTTKENEFLPSLNMERESFFRTVPFVKILWVTTWEMDKIRRETRDFYSWLTLKHDFHALPDEIDPLPSPPPDPPPTPFYTPERLKYTENLESRLDTLGIGEDPDTQRSAANLSKLLAHEYDEAHDFARSELMWKKALAHLQRYPSSEIERAEVKSSIGRALTELRKFREAEEWLVEAKGVFERGEGWRNLVRNGRQLGWLFYEEREWAAALEALDRCEVTASEHRLGNWLGLIFHQKGMIYEGMRQFPQALENYQNALEWKEKTGQQHELGATFHQIGMAYAAMRQFPQALENYQRALEWEEKTGQQHDLGATFHQIGTYYTAMRQFPQALENYQKALEWEKKTRQQQQLGVTFQQIGNAYSEMRQYPRALENYEKALEWKEKTGQQHELGDTFHNIGRVYEEKKNFEEAVYWYKKAIENLEQHDHPFLPDAHASLIRVHHAKTLTPPPKPTGPSLYDQKKRADGYLSSAHYELALPLYEQILKTLESLPPAQREEDRDDLAAAHLGLGICYLHRAGSIRSNPEKEHLEAAYALAKKVLEEGDTLSLPLYLEAGYWLLRSMKKELGGWFSSKSKKAAWESMRTELLASAGQEREWAEKIGGLGVK